MTAIIMSDCDKSLINGEAILGEGIVRLTAVFIFAKTLKLSLETC